MSPDRSIKVEEEIARAREAEQIINAPIYVEAMRKLKQGIIDKWAACPARDTDGREWLWQHYQVALKFEETLAEVLNTGKLALKEREMSLAQKVGARMRNIV